MDGIILSINESQDTCTMKFKNNKIQRNIPMNKIYINEGFLDKLKEYGKKAINYIVKKVKGFIALVDDATGKILPWSLNNVANLAIKAAHGDMPEGVYFAPTKTLKEIAGVKGMSIDQAFAEAEQNDLKNIKKFWTRVIQRTGTQPKETIEESIKYVNKKYYRTSKLYKKALNENIIYTFDNPAFGDSPSGDYGVTLNSVDLKIAIKQNIENQIDGPLGGHAD